jgi:hypothetical protein
MTELGYKLLQSDGTSANCPFRYRLDGEWNVVPGNGSYVALTEGFYFAGGAKTIRDPLIVKLECDEPTGAWAPDGTKCFRRVRFLEGIANFRVLPPDIQGEIARYMPGLSLSDRMTFLRGSRPSWMYRFSWFFEAPEFKPEMKKALLLEAADWERRLRNV